MFSSITQLIVSLRSTTVCPSRIWRTWVPSPHFSSSWRMDCTAMEPASCCMEREQVSLASLKPTSVFHVERTCTSQGDEQNTHVRRNRDLPHTTTAPKGSVF